MNRNLGTSKLLRDVKPDEEFFINLDELPFDELNRIMEIGLSDETPVKLVKKHPLGPVIIYTNSTYIMIGKKLTEKIPVIN